jgi:hypothetical protein
VRVSSLFSCQCLFFLVHLQSLCLCHLCVPPPSPSHSRNSVTRAAAIVQAHDCAYVNNTHQCCTACLLQARHRHPLRSLPHFPLMLPVHKSKPGKRHGNQPCLHPHLRQSPTRPVHRQTQTVEEANRRPNVLEELEHGKRSHGLHASGIQLPENRIHLSVETTVANSKQRRRHKRIPRRARSLGTAAFASAFGNSQRDNTVDTPPHTIACRLLDCSADKPIETNRRHMPHFQSACQ